jgi:hypothetical protein
VYGLDREKLGATTERGNVTVCSSAPAVAVTVTVLVPITALLAAVSVSMEL